MGAPSPSFCPVDPILATVPLRRFAELTAELADLAQAIMCTALHVTISAVIADAIEVDRTAEMLRVATGCAAKTVEQVKLKPTVCDLKAVEMLEPAQQDNCAGKASRGEIELIDELDEAALAKQKVATFREDNAIATRVLELHDRLGGFIKPT